MMQQQYQNAMMQQNQGQQNQNVSMQQQYLNAMMQQQMYGNQNCMQQGNQCGYMQQPQMCNGQQSMQYANQQQMANMQNPNVMQQQGYNQAGSPGANYGNSDGQTITKPGNQTGSGNQLLQGDGFAVDKFNDVLKDFGK